MLNLIVSQVLQVVNPSVSYTTHTGHPSTADKTRYQGVAISLKEFVRAIDKYNIQHDGESKIRQRLRGHPRCDTHKKQYFNVVGSAKTTIDRNDEGSIRCLTCVCVPADEFPQEVFDVLQDGQKMTPDLQDDGVEGIYMNDQRTTSPYKTGLDVTQSHPLRRMRFSCTGVTGRWGLPYHAQNAVRWLALF